MVFKKSNIWTALLLIGTMLILGSASLLITSNLQQKAAIKNAEKTVGSLREAMPSVHDEITDDRANSTMPTMEIEGLSYCGIIELPAYDTELPIYSYWDKNKASRLPCKYSGSIYDSSLIIGGSDNKGQFDFVKTITGNDTVYITDMTGARYSYVVKEIVRTRDVSSSSLTTDEFDLTLFAKNTYSLDYTVVRCKMKNNI